MSEKEDIIISSHILNWTDEVFVDVVDDVKEREDLHPNTEFTRLEMIVNVEEPIRVTDYETSDRK